jgi:glyoxylate reductase
MLILQTIRGASAAEHAIRLPGGWREGLELTPDIRDLTLGIIGLGSIGKVRRRQ